MDNNRDGIIDDPIVTRKKRGRKSLGLTKEQMRVHRAELDKGRRDAKRKEERRAAIEWLVWKAADASAQFTKEAFTSCKDPDDAGAYLNAKMGQFIDELTDDYTLLIKKTEQTKQTLAGYNGGRLRRPRG